MKTLLPFFLVPFSFVAASLTFAQVNCTTYFGGVTSCTGANGYQAQGRQYLGGVESWYDNKGATATVRHGAFGSTSLDTARTSNTMLSNAHPGPLLLSPTKGAHTSEALRGAISSQTLPPASDTYGNMYGHTDSVPDKGSLPKTPEEYRLSVLWMKAVEEKDFDKAEELGRLLRIEKFANATIAGRVHMFNEALSSDRVELMASLDRVEQRIKSEMGAAKVAHFNRFKQKALQLQRKHQEQLQKEFQEQVLKWKFEEEGNTRFAKLETDIPALGKLELDAVELERRETQLLSKWGEAEEKQKKEMMVKLSAELDRLLADKNGLQP